MNYLNWLQKVFPKLKDTPNEIIISYVDEAKSDTELLREFIKVLGGLLFILPFNLYLYISGIQSFTSPLYWLLVIVSFGVGGFIGLYCEQRLIKRRLKKIVQLKYT
ncbi:MULTISPECIES: hypothetical protein [Pseudoalteromonas]|uniref:hypothetical protein n=1 Tax=Pseudoalteromonas TaxID=53246 RepID=UPI001867E412|nr:MULTISPECIES: hypothetical protein [Pseudoalteromonas]